MRSHEILIPYHHSLSRPGLRLHSGHHRQRVHHDVQHLDHRHGLIQLQRHSQVLSMLARKWPKRSELGLMLAIFHSVKVEQHNQSQMLPLLRKVALEVPISPFLEWATLFWLTLDATPDAELY